MSRRFVPRVSRFCAALAFAILLVARPPYHMAAYAQSDDQSASDAPSSDAQSPDGDDGPALTGALDQRVDEDGNHLTASAPSIPTYDPTAPSDAPGTSESPTPSDNDSADSSDSSDSSN
jgi:hypothetical protein